MIRSTIRTVVRPGRSDPLAADASDKLSRNEVMRRISDDGLVEIANLNLDFAAGVSDRAKIAHVTIAANPNLRPLGERAAFHSFKPLVIANRISPHVSMRGSGHFALTDIFQARRASARAGDTLFVFHDYFLP